MGHSFADVLFYLYAAVLLFSAVMAISYHKQLESRRLTIFIPYLVLLFIQEILVYLY